MHDPAAPFAVQAGVAITVKAGSGDTGGTLTVLELVIAPSSGPALHTHLREDELWFVLAGDFRFRAGPELGAITSSRTVSVPPVSPEPALTVIASPVGVAIVGPSPACTAKGAAGSCT